MDHAADFPIGPECRSVERMPVDLLILNYNGRDLLAECLPSVIRAADCSSYRCRVGVIDNASNDGSDRWLAAHYPQVELIRCPNRGLCSYNEVLAEREVAVAVLLNNDVKLRCDAVDPLIRPLLPGVRGSSSRLLMTAPLCWRFDGCTYEGLLTSARWSYGLVQATARFEGHEQVAKRSGPTASAGAVLAVDRMKFLELGGFDPLFLPGRLEDLDLAFRGYLHGYTALYVPDSVAYHGGELTFRREFGPAGSRQLALRNTLLWQWKNVRHPLHVAREVSGLTVRLVVDIFRAPRMPIGERFALAKAIRAALKRWRSIGGPATRASRTSRAAHWHRERAFFRRFHPRTMRERVCQAAAAGREPSAAMRVEPAGDLALRAGGPVG